MTTRTRNVLGLIGWLALSFAAAAIGAIASIDAGEFYASLSRPSWAPPASVFGPVWTTLYALIGIAAWLVWQLRANAKVRAALVLFGVQLALNALWSWLFFGWRLGAAAFFEVLLLWLAIAATLVAFWRIRPLTGALLLPYLAWVTFASALNYAVWQMNPALLGTG